MPAASMKICMVSTFYPPHTFGGDGIAVQRWARALARRGHAVTVVYDIEAYRTLQRGEVPNASTGPDQDGVTIVALESPWGSVGTLLTHQLGRPVVHRRRLREILAPGQFDAVVFHNPSLMGAPEILRWKTGAVMAYMAHEHWLVCPTHLLYRDGAPCVERICLRCTIRHRRPPQLWRSTAMLPNALEQLDLLITLSEFSRAKHQELGITRPIEVIPNFVPTPASDAPLPHTPPHPSPYFLYVGRLEEPKGLDDVLPLFAGREGPALLIAGEGSHGAALRAQAGASPRVRFLGRVEPVELDALYRHAIALLMPSKGYESFPLVLLEALSVGTPFLARNVGPASEIVATTAAGILFDGPADLAPLLHQMAHDADFRDALAARALPAVARHYAEDVVVPQLVALLESAVARNRGP
jgi:glycosyltransferase involved in cell wall biosynthesis